MAVYDPERKGYQLLGDMSNSINFHGLRSSSRSIRQVFAYNSIIRHFSLAKSKYPSLKAKLRDVDIDDISVNCTFSYHKRPVEYVYVGKLKNAISTYADVEFKATSREKGTVPQPILERLKLRPADPMDITLFC